MLLVSNDGPTADLSTAVYMQIGFILLCLALPLLELAVMIKVGQVIGVWWTILALVAMSIVGGMILRRQGFATLRRMIEASRDGRPPIEPVVESVFLMFAGVLLLVPGFITDVFGLLLLIRPLRLGFARWVLGRMFTSGTFTVNGATYRGSAPAAASTDSPSSPGETMRGARGPSSGDDSAGPRADEPTRPRRKGSSVVIDGEWERVDEPTRRPADGGAQRPGSRD